MSRHSLSDEEYQAVAQEKDLELVGFAPPSVFDKATWRCKRCGKVMEKSYRAVKYGRFGCRCQSIYRELPEEAYTQLAEELGIEWVGEEVPQNNRTLTKWKGSPGIVTDLSYTMLKRNKISNITRMILGLVGDL